MSDNFNYSYHLPDILPGLNIKDALLRLSNDKCLLVWTLNEFVRNYSSVTDEIIKKLKNNDVSSSHRIIHSIKGISGTISAHRIYQISQELENAILSDNLEFVYNNLEMLKKEISVVADSISTLQPIEKEEVLTSCHDDASNLIFELDEYLRLSNYNALDQFYKVRKLLQEERYQIFLDKMENYIQMLDFQKARIQLRMIASFFDFPLK